MIPVDVAMARERPQSLPLSRPHLGLRHFAGLDLLPWRMNADGMIVSVFESWKIASRDGLFWPRSSMEIYVR
jgi:hypothetical protein